MTECTSSRTYKILFNDIIGPCLSQILNKYPNYCLRSRNVPYEIERKYEEYKKNASKCMENPKLDRHKLASCICGAIIEAQPIAYLSEDKIPQRVNEILALGVALGVIKYFMMYDIVFELSASEEKQKVKKYLVDNFEIILPDLDDNICDTQEYAQNLFNALLWTHHKCNKIGRECFHYDIWAYSKIFYHIELINKSRLNEIYIRYANSNEEQDN